MPASALAGSSQMLIDEFETLPAWTYENEGFLELEIETLFKRNWQLVCHVSALSRPNSYVTFDALHEQVVVLRAHDNTVRAFHNICRHRGATIIQGSGSCPMLLSCPFHGWTYDQAGRLTAVPLEHTFNNLDKTNIALKPVNIEIWMGFVFIHFQDNPVPLAEQLAPVAETFSYYRIDNMRPIEHSMFCEERPYNWKTIHDIDNEGYHIPVGHPALQQLYGNTYADTVAGDIPISTAIIKEGPSRSWSVSRYQSLLPDYAHLPTSHQRLWYYASLFPNTVIALYPDSIEYYMTLPVNTGTTLYRGGAYTLPDNRRAAQAARYLNRRINNATSDEDERFVESMQRGLKSSARPQPILSKIEAGVSEFHRQIARALPVATLVHCPDSRDIRKMNDAMILTNHDQGISA